MSTYALDTTGTLPANLITSSNGELHTLHNLAHLNYSFIVPNHAPFFKTDFVLEKKTGSNTWSPMTMDLDYTLSSRFDFASSSLDKPVYGSVIINDLLIDPTTHFRIVSYRTLGGDIADDNTQEVAKIINQLLSPAKIYWDSLIDINSVGFPPSVHPIPAYHLTNYGTGIIAMEKIAAAITASTNSIIAQNLLNNN